LFQQVWQKDGLIVAVRPQPQLAPYFAAIDGAKGVRQLTQKAIRIAG
jgi:hypothetical protein